MDGMIYGLRDRRQTGIPTQKDRRTERQAYNTQADTKESQTDRRQTEKQMEKHIHIRTNTDHIQTVIGMENKHKDGRSDG